MASKRSWKWVRAAVVESLGVAAVIWLLEFSDTTIPEPLEPPSVRSMVRDIATRANESKSQKLISNPEREVESSLGGFRIVYPWSNDESVGDVDLGFHALVDFP